MLTRGAVPRQWESFQMRRFLAGLSVIAFVVAACAGAGATPAPAAPVAAKLATGALGQILVDASGRTVYGFIPDEAGGQPTCYDQCADNWLALTVDGAFTVGTGLGQADFSTVTRTDGGSQLKFKEFPLYYFAGDSGPNQTNGQGVGSKWYVVGADGALIGR
jgi:predicted lipoprotein with Yx(FWY)xxD motif